MVKSMKQGSVIVDMAAEQGGNCELTVPGEVVVRHGVTIVGYKDLPSRLAKQASTLYATNLFRLMEDMIKTKSIQGDAVKVDMADDVLRGTTVVNQGAVTWPPPAPKLSVAPAAPAAKPVAAAAKPKGHGHGGSSGPMAGTKTAVLFGVAALLFLLIGRYAPASFLGHFTVFVLACFVGYMVVWNVTPALHTPLMSVTNAVSSIIAIGALVQIAPDLTKISADLSRPHEWIRWLSVAAIALATINMFGGFAVTQRMLQMFRK
jgi:H+-translocating NAD(P) transhydrogenase subunit alpha